MTADRERAVGFVRDYGRSWESWDEEAFLELFAEDVLYVAHATEETVRGRTALGSYFRKEAEEQGEVDVRMGAPVVEDSHVVAEFWVTMRGAEGTIAGCLIARLDSEGRCDLFREYWFEVEGRGEPYEGWGA